MFSYHMLHLLTQTIVFPGKYLVNQHTFRFPFDPDKVKLTRNNTDKLACDEKLFFRVVKQGFQNRRKTLRNALKPLNLPEQINEYPFLNLRAEQLSVADFVALTSKIEELWKSN